MSKKLTAQQVKRLPVMTDIRMVRDSDGATAYYWIIKSGRYKMLKSVSGMTRKIEELPGWHFEEGLQ